jgi:hypothetical protein
MYDPLLLNKPLEDIKLKSNIKEFSNISLDKLIFPDRWKFLPNESWKDLL